MSTIRIKTQKRTRRELLDWIAHHKIKIQTGGQIRLFSLEGHEYLREIYEEHVPEERYRKAAQVGISVYHVLKALWLCDQYKLKVLYYFHTDDAVEEFGADRLDPMIQNTEFLRERVLEARETGGAYNKGLKNIGKSKIFMRGMMTKGKVKTVDGDYLILDELDEANQENKEFAFDRILHSFLQWSSELSQPSIADYGIDKSFQESDQRFWMLRCPVCGHFNCLEEDFPQNFIRSPGKKSKLEGRKYYRGCLKCRAELDMAAGEWVPKYPGRDVRGYHLSQLYTTIKPEHVADPADAIMKKYLRARKSSEKKNFTISILGYPYGGESQPITDRVLDNCEAEYLMSPNAGVATGMGVDVGDTLHIVIRGRNNEGRPRILWMEATEDWGRIGKLAFEFGPPVYVIDAMPYKAKAKDIILGLLKAGLRARGFLQYFKESQKLTTEGMYEKEVNVVHRDRTESLDDTTGEFANHAIEIPAMKIHQGEQLVSIEEFRSHLKQLTADTIERASGVKARVYKTNVPNHFGMAANSARIAEELAGYGTFSPEDFRGAEPRTTKESLSKVFG